MINILIALYLCGITTILGIIPNWALGHTLFDHSEPRVGATLSSCPKQVLLWFDGTLDPSLSSVRVETETGQRVDKLDGQVDSHDRTILEVNLPCLSPGTYRVIWSVVSSDGHGTNGSFSFTIKHAN